MHWHLLLPHLTCWARAYPYSFSCNCGKLCMRHDVSMHNKKYLKKKPLCMLCRRREGRVRQGMQMEQKPHWCHILFFGRRSAQMFSASKFSKRRSLMASPPEQEREMLHLELVKAGSSSPLRCSGSLWLGPGLKRLRNVSYPHDWRRSNPAPPPTLPTTTETTTN